MSASDKRRNAAERPPRYLKSRTFENKKGVRRTIYYWVLKAGMAERYGFEKQVRLVAKEDPTANPATLYHRACLEAEKLNEEYDRRRQGLAVPPAPEDREGTLPYYIKEFRKEPVYEKLSPATRDRTYEYGWRIVSKWSELLGHIPVKRITRAHCRDLYKNLAQRDEDGERMLARARAVMKSLSRILSYAVDEEAIEANPIYGMKMPENELREVAWSDADIKAFTKKATELGRKSLALAVRMAADHGHRRADIIKMRRRDYDGHYLRVVQQKTGARVRVLCPPELKRMLDALPPGKPDDFLVVQDKSGKPYSKDFFSREIRRVADEAGLVLLWFHDLRRTAVQSLADAGCTIPEIVAVTGHTLESATKILEHYYFANQGIAENAIIKLMEQRARKRKVESGAELIVESGTDGLGKVLAFPRG